MEVEPSWFTCWHGFDTRHMTHIIPKWHIIPKLGVCFVVWELTWHRNCSHLLSTQPSCSQANIIAVVMLAGSGVTKYCEERQKKQQVTLCDRPANFCRTLTSTTVRCWHLGPAGAVSQDVSLICCFLSGWGCLQAKMSNLLPLTSSCFGTSPVPHGSVAILTSRKWRKIDMFGCCSRVLLLTLKCAVSVPHSGANSHHNFFALSVICMSLHVCKVPWRMPVFRQQMSVCSALCWTKY